MCKTLLAVLASCWKLRLEYYKNITAACTLGLCAKIKKGLEGGGAGRGRNNWNEKGHVLRISGCFLANIWKLHLFMQW